VRHADAGYEQAVEFAGQSGLRMPMLDPEPPAQ
jgi:urocanate hydratase